MFEILGWKRNRAVREQKRIKNKIDLEISSVGNCETNVYKTAYFRVEEVKV